MSELESNRLYGFYPRLPTVPSREQGTRVAQDAMRRMGKGEESITAEEVADFILEIWRDMGMETYPDEVVEEIDGWLEKNWGYSSAKYYDDIATLTLLVSNTIPEGKSVKLLLTDRTHPSDEIRKLCLAICVELDPVILKSQKRV